MWKETCKYGYHNNNAWDLTFQPADRVEIERLLRGIGEEWGDHFPWMNWKEINLYFLSEFRCSFYRVHSAFSRTMMESQWRNAVIMWIWIVYIFWNFLTSHTETRGSLHWNEITNHRKREMIPYTEFSIQHVFMSCYY